MKTLTLLALMAAVPSVQARAQSAPQIQEVKFENCSGGSLTLGGGAGFILCRSVRYYKDGKEVVHALPQGGKMKLSFLQVALGGALTATRPEESFVSCVIPNFDPQKGFNEVVGGYFGGGGAGEGGEVSLAWGSRSSCRIEIKGGGGGAMVGAKLAFLRVPASK